MDRAHCNIREQRSILALAAGPGALAASFMSIREVASGDKRLERHGMRPEPWDDKAGDRGDGNHPLLAVHCRFIWNLAANWFSPNDSVLQPFCSCGDVGCRLFYS